MKKIILFMFVFLLITSIEGFSQDKKQESRKKPKVEQISEKKAKSKASPDRKRTQKRMQQQRITYHNQKKTNNMWK